MKTFEVKNNDQIFIPGVGTLKNDNGKAVIKNPGLPAEELTEARYEDLKSRFTKTINKTINVKETSDEQE